MILDTSAVLAILRAEPEARAFNRAIAEAPSVAISAGTLVEAGMVAAGMVAEGRAHAPIHESVERLLMRARAEVAPFTAEQARMALDGWRRFGKGRHPAALNLGDCFAYALAKSRDEPLLFKGDDFSRTDVTPALPSHG